jgi:hypothetical protein
MAPPQSPTGILSHGTATPRPALQHARHWALLLLATPLAFVGIPSGPGIRFAVFGMLHAATIWASLRRRPALGRGLAFVLAAGLTSAGAVELGLLWIGAGPPAFVVLSACSAAGALGYGWSIQGLLRVRFARGALLVAAIACALAVFAVASLISASRLPALPSIAVVWWYTFSGGLCWADGIKWRQRD